MKNTSHKHLRDYNHYALVLTDYRRHLTQVISHQTVVHQWYWIKKHVAKPVIKEEEICA